MKRKFSEVDVLSIWMDIFLISPFCLVTAVGNTFLLMELISGREVSGLALSIFRDEVSDTMACKVSVVSVIITLNL